MLGDYLTDAAGEEVGELCETLSRLLLESRMLKVEPSQKASKSSELKKKKLNKEEQRQSDALDKRIEEFMAHKLEVPLPTVIHDKEDPFK